MSREWLEDIKERFVKYEYDYNLNGEDVEWLIQQAERVEELEKERDEWKNTAQTYYMTNQELREQNKRYREAINNIIEKAVYDAIQDAIKVLEESK